MHRTVFIILTVPKRAASCRSFSAINSELERLQLENLNHHVDLYMSGVKGKCLVTTYELNKYSNVTVQNESGKSDKFTIGENVKQGTVWATLCVQILLTRGLGKLRGQKQWVLTMEK